MSAHERNEKTEPETELGWGALFKEAVPVLEKGGGMAWSGGGRGIIRVDISVDNGNNWFQAELKEGSDQDPLKAWAWTFWEIKLPVAKYHEIISKAVDSSYNTQPENIKSICPDFPEYPLSPRDISNMKR